jgi:hypothetical protein
MKKFFDVRKIVASLSITVALIFPALAYAASHTFVYDFSHMVKSKVYPMNGSNITITTTPVDYSSGAKGHMRVELYRNVEWGFDDYIGYRTVPLTSTGSASWSGIDSGDYYFKLWKNQDGHNVQGYGTIRN